MISRAIFWELECASWKDGDHQWYAALAALTLPGAGEGTDNPQRPTANAGGVQYTRSRRTSFSTPRTSGASCTRTWKAKMTPGQAWAWTSPKQFSALGKNQKDDRRPTKKGPQKKTLHQEEASKIRVAGEVLTILAEAALENEQIDKAMEAMGIAQKMKKEENVVVARGGGPKSVHTGLGQAARHGLFAENSKTKVRYLGSRLTWKDVLLHGEGNKNCRPGTLGT